MKTEKTLTVKHTPGPWTVGTDCKVWGSGKPNCYKSDACFVAACGNDQDAALIAAAPELLDALTDLVGGCGKEGDLFSGTAMEKARAAIAKAEGRAI